METKVITKKAKKQALAGVSVEIHKDYVEILRIFFGMLGMKKSFLDAPNTLKHTRKQLDNALETSTFKLELYRDVKAFVNDNADEVIEFLPSLETLKKAETWAAL